MWCECCTCNQRSSRAAVAARLAVEGGDAEALRTLLEHERDVARLRPHAPGLVRLAVDTRQAEILNLLAAHGLVAACDPRRDFEQWRPLLGMVRAGDLTWVRLLCETGIRGDPSGCPPIFCALKTNTMLRKTHMYAEIVEVLLAHGEDVNTMYDGETAVFYAAKDQQWQTVEALLKRGARIDTYCGDRTARTILTNLRPDLLLSYPAADTRFELLQALKRRDEEQFLALLQQNTEMCDAENDQGMTLLQLAVRGGCLRAVSQLLESGADPNRDVQSRPNPPVTMALLAGNRDMFTTILYHVDTKLNVKYRGNNTIYHVLAREWRYIESDNRTVALECAKDLFQVAYQESVNILEPNRKCQSAVNMACKCKDKEFLSLFFEYGGFRAVNEQALKKVPPEWLREFLETTVSVQLNQTHVTDHVDVRFAFIDAALRSCGASGKPDAEDSSGSSDQSSSLYLRLESGEGQVNDLDAASLPETAMFLQLSCSPAHRPLLAHPVVRLFLYLKFRRVLRLYLINLACYACFTGLLTAYLLEPYMPQWCLLLIFWAAILLRETLQCALRSPIKFLSSVENLMELTLICLVGYLLFADLHTGIAAVSVLISYIELTLLLGRLPYITTYVKIFVQVTKKSIGLIIIFFPIIFAFSMAFTLLFSTVQPSDDFTSLGTAIFRTMIMLTGEIEVTSFKYNAAHEIITRLILITFLVLAVIVFANVLNALAISDTRAIIEEAELLSCVQQVELYARLDQLWSSVLAHRFLLPCCQLLRLQVFPLKLYRGYGSCFQLNVYPSSWFGKVVRKYVYGFDHVLMSKQFIEIAQGRKKKRETAVPAHQVTSSESRDIKFLLTSLEKKMDKLTAEVFNMKKSLGMSSETNVDVAN